MESYAAGEALMEDSIWFMGNHIEELCVITPGVKKEIYNSYNVGINKDYINNFISTLERLALNSPVSANEYTITIVYSLDGLALYPKAYWNGCYIAE